MRKNILINDESFIAHLTAEWAETRTYCIDCDHSYAMHETRLSGKVKDGNVTLTYKYFCSKTNCDCITEIVS